jgi:dienelactone hydrolase
MSNSVEKVDVPRGVVGNLRARCTRFGKWLMTSKPGPRAWTGAALGAFLAGILVVWVGIGDSKFGFGTAYDVGVAILVDLVAVALGTLVALLIVRLLRLVPLRVVAALLGGVVAMVGFQALRGSVDPTFLIVAQIIPFQALFGLALGAVLGGELVGASRLKKFAMLALLAITLAANVGLVWRLAGAGSDGHLTPPHLVSTPATALTIADPSARGPFDVRTFTYGSGVEPGRTDFGDRAEFTTEPVDASVLLKDLKGFRKAARGWYWGFQPERFPLNGHVWQPEGAGPFPLVLIVHGNHTMEEYSDPGYQYLCEHLASHGYIAVSVDENFLNGSWSGDFRGKELPARAWMLLQHLKQWRTWNSTPGHRLANKVDFDKIALVGHSRGGEAAAVAALFNRLSRYPENGALAFDFGFSIRGVAAIAPSEGFYKPAGHPVRLKDVDYFVIQGAHDADVAIFMGSKQYQNVNVAGDAPHFKCALYVDRANHGQFNTVWGQRDWPEPFHRLQNVKPLLQGDDQRRIAAVYLTAFLESSLRRNTAYLPMFLDPRRAASWLPAATYVSRFQDSSFLTISDFEGGVDLGKTTYPGGTQAASGMKEWREASVPFRAGDNSQENRAVFLEWEKSDTDNGQSSAEFRIELPPDFGSKSPLASGTGLRFALARADNTDDPIDLTVRLESADGQSAQVALDPIGPPIRIRISKLIWEEKALMKPFELILGTTEIPLADFAKTNPRLDVKRLRSIAFQFDRSHAGSVYLDDIGFGRPADGLAMK